MVLRKYSSVHSLIRRLKIFFLKEAYLGAQINNINLDGVVLEYSNQAIYDSLQKEKKKMVNVQQ